MGLVTVCGGCLVFCFFPPLLSSVVLCVLWWFCCGVWWCGFHVCVCVVFGKASLSTESNQVDCPQPTSVQNKFRHQMFAQPPCGLSVTKAKGYTCCLTPPGKKQYACEESRSPRAAAGHPCAPSWHPNEALGLDSLSIFSRYFKFRMGLGLVLGWVLGLVSLLSKAFVQRQVGNRGVGVDPVLEHRSYRPKAEDLEGSSTCWCDRYGTTFRVLGMNRKEIPLKETTRDYL